MTEQEPQRTPEELNAELGKWEKAKLAAATVTLIALSVLTAEMVTGIKTSSDQVQSAMQWAMIGSGLVTGFSIASVIEFSRYGDRTIRSAQRLGAKMQKRFFVRRLITPDQQAA